jgi:hypothetical protein
MKVRAGLAAAAVLLGLLVVVPADAATCPTGYLCLYKGYGFRGDIVKLKRTGYSEKIYYWMNDKASSVKNKSGRDVTLYADFESGDFICVDSGEKISDLSTTIPDMDDTISSTTTHANDTTCV